MSKRGLVRIKPEKDVFFEEQPNEKLPNWRSVYSSIVKYDLRIMNLLVYRASAKDFDAFMFMVEIACCHVTFTRLWEGMCYDTK